MVTGKTLENKVITEVLYNFVKGFWWAKWGEGLLITWGLMCFCWCINYKPVSQSVAEVKREKYWVATGQAWYTNGDKKETIQGQS